MKSYDDALNRIYQRQRFGVKFGLTNISNLLRLLGDPHRRYPSVLVGGTNGKGSTASFIAHLLRAHGYRTGLYTSPHLEDFRARIQVDGSFVREEEVLDMAATVDEAIERGDQEELALTTFFEYVTAMAYSHFARRRVDLAVLEVGMGGRLDATNAADPEVSVITNVALDHAEYLGSTIEKVAWEKAGIIKERKDVVAGELSGEPLSVVERICRERRARLHLGDEDFRWKVIRMDSAGALFDYADDVNRYNSLRITIPGEHQVVNASTALRVCHLLAGRGFSINEEGIRKGLREASWSGRLEVVRRNPAVLLDCAHNPHGAAALKKSLLTLFDYDRLILVLGIMGDKDIGPMISALGSIAAKMIVAKPAVARAAETSTLQEAAMRVGLEAVAAATVSSALDMALDEASERDLICVAGSIFTVAEARARFVPMG